MPTKPDPTLADVRKAARAKYGKAARVVEWHWASDCSERHEFDVETTKVVDGDEEIGIVISVCNADRTTALRMCLAAIEAAKGAG